MVPDKSGCYVLSTFDNQILYIGQAVNLCKRFLQHLDNPEKTQPTSNGTAWLFWFFEYNAEKLSFLENSWLQEYQQLTGELPVLNKVQAPIR
jgi:excinuclease UvrABC nuclease subunit